MLNIRQNTRTGVKKNIYNSCKKHLNSDHLNEDEFLNWTQEKPLPFCTNCFKWTGRLTEMNNKLEEILKQIEHVVNSFTIEFVILRENPNNDYMDFSIEESASFFTINPFDDTGNLDDSHSKSECISIKDEYDVTDFFEENVTDELSNFDKDSSKLEMESEVVKNVNSSYSQIQERNESLQIMESFSNQLYATVTVNLTNMKFDMDGKPLPDCNSRPRRKAAMKADQMFSPQSNNIVLKEPDKTQNASADESKPTTSKEENRPFSKIRRKQKPPTRRRPNHQGLVDGENMKTYNCKTCGQVCKSPQQLFYHRSITHNAEPCNCTECDKEFTNKESLKSHVKSVHRPPQRHLCTICAKEFSTHYGLTEHMKRHDRDPNDEKSLKQFTCHQCGKSFTTKGSLNVHIKRHMEIQRYECPMKCGKRFTTKSDMKDHIKHHKGEKPFLCEECGQSFFTKTKLKYHTRIHTGLLCFCEYCGKGFQTSTHLKQHYRSHNKTPKESTSKSIKNN